MRDRVHVVLHVDGGLDRLDHPEVHHRVDPHRHVVASHALLRGHSHGDDLHVDLLQPVADRPDEGKARLEHMRLHPAEPVQDALLVLLNYL